ncbi:MAG: hypothetical protein CM15mV4_0880 [Caudoviricetes sp.]|nr:MAG: hypothetical protein CM15mV4_0880 [Caudoviricetes sp.]
MAQVTYRGVKYDTDRPKTSMNNNKKTLVYRGVPVNNKEEVCKYSRDFSCDGRCFIFNLWRGTASSNE